MRRVDYSRVKGRIDVEEIERCCHCGRSVAWGSSLYAGRVPDCNDIAGRVAYDRIYPEGDFVCWECDMGSDAEEDEGCLGNNEDFADGVDDVPAQGEENWR